MNRAEVMHIVPALFGYEGVYGGAERYALELARAMAERVPTTLIAYGAVPMSRREGPLQIEVLRNWIPYRRFRFDPFSPSLALRLSRAKFVHYHQTHTLMAGITALIGKAAGRPVFTTHLGGGGFGFHRVCDTTNWFAGHLHISRFSMKAFGHADLPCARVIGGGVDFRIFHPGERPPTRDFILFAGRLLPHKGIDYLIQAMPPEVPLVIAGRPWPHSLGFYRRLIQLAEGKRITFLEQCSDADLVELYRNARCIVLPSVYRTSTGEEYAIPELLGQTLLEGMACRTPGIATDVGAMPEVVEHGVSGFVVPPNDTDALRSAILTLWHDATLTERMGEAALQRTQEQFDWSRVVDRCLDAYYREGAK